MGQLEEEVESEVASAEHHEFQRLRQDRFHDMEATRCENLFLREIDEALELIVFQSFRGANLVVEWPEDLVSHC